MRLRSRRETEVERPAAPEKVTYQKPVTESYQLYPGRLLVQVKELVRGAMETVTRMFSPSPDSPAPKGQQHCGVCQAEFSGQWRADGTPIYTGGVIDVKVFDPRLGKFVPRVRACSCTAGAPYRRMNVTEATPRDIAQRKRLLRWRRRAFRRMAPPQAIDIAINSWPESFMRRWGAETHRIMGEGLTKPEAQRLAFILVGDDLDQRRLLP